MKRQRRKIGNLLKCIRRWRLIDALPPVAMMMIGLGFFFTVDLDTRIKKNQRCTAGLLAVADVIHCGRRQGLETSRPGVVLTSAYLFEGLSPYLYNSVARLSVKGGNRLKIITF